MTEVERLARFITSTDYAQLSDEASEQLKIRVLDTLGVAIGALDAAPMRAVRALTEFLGGNPASTLIGGGCSAPDRAAFYNVALSRYLGLHGQLPCAG
jgi:2-methylcitrate dehydratase